MGLGCGEGLERAAALRADFGLAIVFVEGCRLNGTVDFAVNQGVRARTKNSWNGQAMNA